MVTPTKPEVHGFEVSGQIATFIDEDGESTNPDQYRVGHAALIDWGDGTVAFGTVVKNADGTYGVNGSHVYAAAGDYVVKLFVRRNQRWVPMLSPRHYYGPKYAFTYEGPWLFGTACSNADGAGATANNPADTTFEQSAVLYTLHVDGAGTVAQTPAKGNKPDAVQKPPKQRQAPPQRKKSNKKAKGSPIARNTIGPIVTGTYRGSDAKALRLDGRKHELLPVITY